MKPLKIVQFILQLMLIFFIFLCTCHAKDTSFDMLSVGDEILKSTGLEVYDRIVHLWKQLLSHHSHVMTHQIDAETMRHLLDVPELAITECSGPTIARVGNIKLEITDCESELMEKVQFINNFNKTTSKINELIEEIHTMFVSAFLIAKPEEDPDGYNPTDHLYKLISDSCTNRDECLFHHLAGRHSLINSRNVRTPSAVAGEVYYVYLTIIFHFLKGYATDIYRYEHRSNVSEIADRIKWIQWKFLHHTQDVGNIVLSAIKNAPREIIREEPPATSSLVDSPYFAVKWYISQVIVNEANLNAENTCSNTCSDYKETKFYEHGSVPSEGKDVCRGAILYCDHQPLGYLYPTNNDWRRYGGIKTVNGSLGDITALNSSGKHTNDIYDFKTSSSGTCDVCTCLCDDYENPETIRTFSLRPVTSDIAQNMAITGLKLVERHGVIYIQIRQGQLKAMHMTGSSRWVRVQMVNETADPSHLFSLRYPVRNRVNLDTISIQDHFVQDYLARHDINRIWFPNSPYLLTGVKFVNQQGVLSLGIRLTMWHPESQKFSSSKWSNWIFNTNRHNRFIVNRAASDALTNVTPPMRIVGPVSEDLWAQFRTTSNVKDFGQTTIPLLDGRPVFTEPPMPVSGAGLYYKHSTGFAGVIGLKLVSIDYSDLIVSELK